MENKKFAGYKAALGAFLVIFVNIGVCTTLGVFIAQLASFSGWSLSACVIIGTINTIVNLLLSLVAIPVAKKIGYRWIMLISILAVALHVNMYCFATPGQNVGTLICFYIGGALASVAIAFGSHAVCSGLIAEWFLDSHQREKVTGTVLSGAGFGAAIWVFLAGQLFKYFTWQQCYRIITVIALVFGLIAVLFLIRTPKEVGQLPMPAKEENDTVTDPSKLPRRHPQGRIEVRFLLAACHWYALLCHRLLRDHLLRRRLLAGARHERDRLLQLDGCVSAHLLALAPDCRRRV